MNKNTTSIVLALVPWLAAACGGQSSAAQADAEHVPGLPTADERRERTAELVAKATAGAPDYMTEMKREVRLPSHRRLESFLPRELRDFPHVALESELEPRQGTAKAEGRYQLSPAHYRGAVEVQVVYFGKEAFNGPRKFFDAGIGDETEIAGFPALREQQDDRGEARYEIQVQVSPELYVIASGPGSFELMQDAVEAVDLSALAKAARSEEIFEETREDRLERTILSRSEIEGLIPAALGNTELASVNSLAQLDQSPMHARASGRFGAGDWTLIDYGDAEVAAALALAPADNQNFKLHAHGREELVQEQALDLADGRGAWVRLASSDRRPALLSIQAVRGRFVFEYASPFQPAVEIDTNLPEEIRAQLAQQHTRMGAGAFDSIEEQRDVAIAAFESLDIEN